MSNILNKILVAGYSHNHTPREISFNYSVAVEHAYGGFLTDIDSIRFIDGICKKTPVIAGVNMPYSGVPNDMIVEMVINNNEDEDIYAFLVMLNKSDVIIGDFDEIRGLIKEICSLSKKPVYIGFDINWIDIIELGKLVSIIGSYDCPLVLTSFSEVKNTQEMLNIVSVVLDNINNQEIVYFGDFKDDNGAKTLLEKGVGKIIVNGNNAAGIASRI